MIARGDIWWAQLGRPRGSSLGYRRPVLVVSADSFNRSKIATVVAVTISSNLKLADAPGNVSLPRLESGLDKESVVNVSQVLTLDKNDLADWVGPVESTTMRQVELGLRLSLAL